MAQMIEKMREETDNWMEPSRKQMEKLLENYEEAKMVHDLTELVEETQTSLTSKFDMMVDEIEKLWSFCQGFVDNTSLDFI